MCLCLMSAGSLCLYPACDGRVVRAGLCMHTHQGKPQVSVTAAYSESLQSPATCFSLLCCHLQHIVELWVLSSIMSWAARCMLLSFGTRWARSWSWCTDAGLCMRMLPVLVSQDDSLCTGSSGLRWCQVAGLVGVFCAVILFMLIGTDTLLRVTSVLAESF